MRKVYTPVEERYDNGMKYRRCGKSGIFLPEISLGLWHNFGDVNPLSNSMDMAHYAFDHGICHFDLANNYGPPYGSAEETFGQIMRRSFHPYRDELFISTKAGYDMWPGPYGNWGSRKYLMASLDQSLKRMNVEYVDLFYIHRYDPDVEESGVLDQAKENGVGFISFSPLAQGLLTDRYLDGIPADSRIAHGGHLKKESLTETRLHQIKALNEIAEQRGQNLAEMSLSWVLKDERVTSVIVGSSSVSQIEKNLRALQSEPFTQEEQQRINNICSV